MAILLTSPPSKDAFGLAEVASPQVDFDAQLTYDAQPLLYELVEGNGTITHNEDNATLDLALTGLGDTYVQTYRYFPYRPGIGKKVFITFNFQGPVADKVKYVQFGDALNAMGLRLYDNGDLKAYIRSETDLGNQESEAVRTAGLGIDVTNEQIMVIQFEALYVGSVQIGLQIGQKIIWVATFDNANRTKFPYVRTANLPVRVGITSIGSSAATMIFNCCSVQNMGGSDDIAGYDFVEGATVTAGNETVTHALTLRPKALFKTKVNRVDYKNFEVNVTVTGNNAVRWQLVLGQALTTPTFGDVNTAYSSMESVSGATLSGLPAIVVDGGTLPAGSQFKGSTQRVIPFKYPITLDAAGANRDLGALTLLVEGIGGTSTVECYMHFRENR